VAGNASIVAVRLAAALAPHRPYLLARRLQLQVVVV